MNFSTLLGAGLGIFSLIFIVLWWNRERIKRAIAERELTQVNSDLDLNKIANANLIKRQEQIAKVMDNNVDPNDPWRELRNPPKNKSAKIRSTKKAKSNSKIS